MNHEEYEKQMIETVNRHADERSNIQERATAGKKRVFTKADVTAMRLGLKRTALALLTIILFALSLVAFIATALVNGYWAVGLFALAIVLLVFAFIFLYAQGIIIAGRQGDSK